MKQDKINEIRESRSIHASTVPERQCDIDAVKLASHLGISQHMAAETLKNTTQSHRAQLWGHLPNRLLTRQSHMRFPRIKDIIYSNTFFASVPSKSRNNTCAQLFATANDFCEAYLMKTKGDAGDKLDAFITKHGIPSSLHTDGAKEEQIGKRNEVRKKFQLTQTSNEPHTPQQNRTELEIRDTKDHYCCIIDRKRVPQALWDLGITYTKDIRQVISRPNIDYQSAIEC